MPRKSASRSGSPSTAELEARLSWMRDAFSDPKVIEAAVAAIQKAQPSNPMGSDPSLAREVRNGPAFRQWKAAWDKFPAMVRAAVGGKAPTHSTVADINAALFANAPAFFIAYAWRSPWEKDFVPSKRPLRIAHDNMEFLKGLPTSVKQESKRSPDKWDMRLHLIELCKGDYATAVFVYLYAATLGQGPAEAKFVLSKVDDADLEAVPALLWLKRLVNELWIIGENAKPSAAPAPGQASQSKGAGGTSRVQPEPLPKDASFDEMKAGLIDQIASLEAARWSESAPALIAAIEQLEAIAKMAEDDGRLREVQEQAADALIALRASLVRVATEAPEVMSGIDTDLRVETSDLDHVTSTRVTVAAQALTRASDALSESIKESDLLSQMAALSGRAERPKLLTRALAADAHARRMAGDLKAAYVPFHDFLASFAGTDQPSDRDESSPIATAAPLIEASPGDHQGAAETNTTPDLPEKGGAEEESTYAAPVADDLEPDHDENLRDLEGQDGQHAAQVEVPLVDLDASEEAQELDEPISIADVRRLFDAKEPGLALALARSLDALHGKPPPGGPAMYALLAAAMAQNEVIPTSNAHLDRHLGHAMSAIGPDDVARENKPLIIAALAAALRPALFDLPTGNPLPFLSQLASAPGISQSIKALAAMPGRAAAEGVHDLRPEILATGFQSSEAHVAARMKDHAARAQAILDRKDSECVRNLTSFQPAQQLYDHLLSPAHEVGAALAALTDQDKPAIRRAVAAAMQVLSGDRAALIRSEFKSVTGFSDTLKGAHLERIESLLDVLEVFFQRVRQDLAPADSQAIARAAAYAEKLDSSLKAVDKEMVQLVSSEDQALALASGVMLTVIRSLRSIIATGATLTTNAPVDQFLNRHLPLTTIDISTSLTGEAASLFAVGVEYDFACDAQNVVEILSNLALPLNDSQEAYTEAAIDHMDHGRRTSAKLCVDLAEAYGPAPGAEIIRRRLNTYNKDRREDTRHLAERYRMALNSLYAQGDLDDPEHSEMHALIDRVMQLVEQLPHVAPISTLEERALPHDVDGAREYLETHIGGPVARVEARIIESLRAEIEREQSSLQAPLADQVGRIHDLLDRRELEIARNYWTMLKSGQVLPDTGQRATVVEEFHRDFLTSFDGPGLSNILKLFRDHLDRGEALPYKRPAQDDSGVQPHTGALLSDWFGLFGNKTAAAAKALENFLTTHFGLSRLTIHVAKQGAIPMFRVEGVHFASAVGPGQFLLPELGSTRGGTFTFALLPHGVKRHEVAEAAEQADIVFVRNAITPVDREALYLRFKKQSNGALIIDDALIAFASQWRHPINPILAVASTFSVTNPYADAQNMPSEMFFGREKPRQAILSATSGVLVFGGRRLGKSSLLLDIQRRSSADSSNRHYIYVDMIAVTAEDYRSSFYTRVAQKMIESKLLPKGVSASAAPGVIIKEIRAAVKERNLEVVLLIDEADEMLSHESKENPRFPLLVDLNTLLKDTNGRFRFVIAGLHNTERLSRYPNSVLDQMGDPIALTPFIDAERAAGLDLVVKPFEALGFRFESQDMPYEIVSRALFFPALIQVYCQAVLDKAVETCVKGLPPYIITAETLRAVDLDRQLSRRLLDIFTKTLELDPRYRVITLCMAYLYLEDVSGTKAAVRVSQLTDLVKGFAPKLFPASTDNTVVDALCDELVNLGVLLRVGTDRKVQLRSISLMSQFGTKDKIDHALVEAEHAKLERDEGEQRVAFSNGTLCPLPLRVIAGLGQSVGSRSTVRLLAASPATGSKSFEMLGLDSTWLQSRATASNYRSIRPDGQDLIDAAIKAPLTPGRLTMTGIASSVSRSVLVVPVGWPVNVLQGLRRSEPQIIKGERSVLLTVDPQQAEALLPLDNIPFPVISAGLWNEDSVHYYLRWIDREGTLTEPAIADLLKVCGRVPDVIRSVLDDGKAIPSTHEEAMLRAGLPMNGNEMLSYFGVPPSLSSFVSDLAATEFSRAEFVDNAGATLNRANPEFMFELLVAMGAIVGADGSNYMLNPLLAHALIEGS